MTPHFIDLQCNRLGVSLPGYVVMKVPICLFVSPLAQACVDIDVVWRATSVFGLRRLLCSFPAYLATKISMTRAKQKPGHKADDEVGLQASTCTSRWSSNSADYPL